MILIVGFTVLAVVAAVIWSAIAGGGIRALPLFVAGAVLYATG